MSSPASPVVPPDAPALRTYRRLLGYVRPYRGRLAAGLLCGLFYALSNGALVWVIKGGFGEVFDPGAMQRWLLLCLVLMFPAVALVRGMTDYLATYYVRWVGHHVVLDLRNAMFRHVHDLSVGYFTESRTGELISRTANDTMLVERAVSSVLTDVAKQPVTLACMIAWVLILDVHLALVSFVAFPLCLIPIIQFGRRVRKNTRQAQEHVADLVSILQETVSGVRIVKAFGMEQYETGRFEACNRSFFGRVMRVARAGAIVQPIIVFIATVGIALVLLYVRTVRMPMGDFFAFGAAMFMMYDPVKKLSKIHLAIQQSSAAADRVFEVLDTEADVRDRPDAVPLEGDVREIAFEDVGFSYGDEQVLAGISFAVKAGERVALVGSSGAGKTTLVNLLPRFYDASSGRVTINGTDLRSLTLKSLRARMGLVTQETFLFNDTVAHNISYGSEQRSPRDIEEAARKAHAHEFIAAMPQQYDTVIGERGVRLSGGQRQRLAMARAILRNPPILVLDEATSALDTESERLVQAGLNELMTGRTVFAIAHRLSTIINCDRIFVLERGRVAEQGTHAELLALGGTYKRLYDLQFEDVRGET